MSEARAENALKSSRLHRLAAAFVAMLAAALPVRAIEPFVVKDIRVEGVQRTEAGTVFSYLPVKVGERIDDEKAVAAVKALYATGFYADVRLEAEGEVLVVSVQERPAIASIDIEGAKEFTKDNLKDGLKQAGIVEAKIYDKSVLDRAEKELKRQYTARGFYSARVTTTVTPLERNRAALRFDIEEGEVTRIADINIIGAKAFSERELLREMQLTTPGWLTWLTKEDQYSKQKLTADLESLRSYYLNRGFLEFNIESTQVSITPDRQKIFITIVLNEGPVYRIGEIRFGGTLIVPERELRELVSLGPGETFSRQKVVNSVKAITDRLSNDGYSFANVNPVPDVDRDKRVAAFTFVVEPGRRVYVRRVNIVGNARTQDVVIRRELRQLEASWYSLDKIARSKERLQRTGYFSEVNIETPPVPGTQDQVDAVVTVTEKNTGTLNFGVGYSQVDNLTVSASISQANVFGSGNQLAFQVNSGSVNQIYSLSFLNPYWTVDGVAAGIDLYRRKVDTASTALSTYQTTSTGLGVNFGVPITEYDAIRLGLAFENTKLDIDPVLAPPRYVDFVNQFGEVTDTLRATVGYTRDSRDSLTYATRGWLTDVLLEVGVPPGDLLYYRATLRQQFLYTHARLPWLTLLLNGELGYADGYNDKPLPFFKNFYAGGSGSVRGFESASLGPRDINGDALGGNRKFIANAELLFPMPGLKDKSVRLSTFVDTGWVWGPLQDVSGSDLRASAGLAVSWDSPVGPLKFSFSYPFRTKEIDKIERFQFQLGSVF